jgi:hypothetical protein
LIKLLVRISISAYEQARRALLARNLAARGQGYCTYAQHFAPVDDLGFTAIIEIRESGSCETRGDYKHREIHRICSPCSQIVVVRHNGTCRALIRREDGSYVFEDGGAKAEHFEERLVEPDLLPRHIDGRLAAMWELPPAIRLKPDSRLMTNGELEIKPADCNEMPF